jgi:hypothetical protein
MKKSKTETLREINNKRKAEIIDFAVAVANTFRTHISCQECGAKNEINEMWYTGMVKDVCCSCTEELDFNTILGIKNNIPFMKWVSKRVPVDDYENIPPEKTPRQKEVDSFLAGMEKMTKCKKPKSPSSVFRLDARLTNDPEGIEFKLNQEIEELGELFKNWGYKDDESKDD